MSGAPRPGAAVASTVRAWLLAIRPADAAGCGRARCWWASGWPSERASSSRCRHSLHWPWRCSCRSSPTSPTTSSISAPGRTPQERLGPATGGRAGAAQRARAGDRHGRRRRPGRPGRPVPRQRRWLAHPAARGAWPSSAPSPTRADRGRTATTASARSSSSSSSGRSPWPARPTCRPAPWSRWRWPRPSRSARSSRPSSWSTTCATSMPTDAPASARWRSDWGTARHGAEFDAAAGRGVRGAAA